MGLSKIVRALLVVTAMLCAAHPSLAQERRLEERRLENHVLNRLAFGPDAESLAEMERLGVDGWIDRQLRPETIVESPALTGGLDRLDTQKLDAVALFQAFGPPPRTEADPEAIKAARRRSRIIVREAAMARLMRAIDSRRQLQEVMVDFWFNHFNVFAQKGLDHLWIGDYENRAIRPHALGRFRDLLGATAHHPAMLFYLDNWQNSAPGSPGARGREAGLNENYARELMELHTLGVEGGYSQDDVVALARILTGWGIARPREGLRPSDNGFAFDARRHDFGDKIFLGHAIRGEGAGEVEQALDILAASPATARHISFQLAQYFVADQPPPALVEQLAQQWLSSGGDIRAVLQTLFASREFRSPDSFGGKFKTPFAYVVSALRAADRPVGNFRPLLGTMARLGQPLYGCLTPDGYKNTREAWLNPDALTLRIGFATALGSGRLPLDRPPPASPEEEEEEMSPPQPPVLAQMEPVRPLDSDRLESLLELSAQTRAAVEAARPPLKAALILGSPDFMTR